MKDQSSETAAGTKIARMYKTVRIYRWIILAKMHKARRLASIQRQSLRKDQKIFRNQICNLVMLNNRDHLKVETVVTKRPYRGWTVRFQEFKRLVKLRPVVIILKQVPKDNKLLPSHQSKRKNLDCHILIANNLCQYIQPKTQASPIFPKSVSRQSIPSWRKTPSTYVDKSTRITTALTSHPQYKGWSKTAVTKP